MKDIGEKLKVRGVVTLSDLELLSLLLDGVADRDAAAKRVLDLCGWDLKSLSKIDIDELRMVGDFDSVRAARLLAACELGRRAISFDQSEIVVSGSGDVVRIFRPMVDSLKHEECWVMHLNAANRLIEIQRVSQGGVTETTVDNRLIVKRSLELLSSHLILVHNHPSGAVEPSGSDVELTRRLRSAVELFNIDLLDHIIISSSDEFSFAGNGMLN